MTNIKIDHNLVVTKLSEMRKHSEYGFIKLPILNLEKIAFDINIQYVNRQIINNPEEQKSLFRPAVQLTLNH